MKTPGEIILGNMYRAYKKKAKKNGQIPLRFKEWLKDLKSHG